MSDAPLTLAEFEREAALMLLPPPLRDNLVAAATGFRTLLLRAFAGERERVAAEASLRFEGEYVAEMVIAAIRAMGDPT